MQANQDREIIFVTFQIIVAAELSDINSLTSVGII